MIHQRTVAGLAAARAQGRVGGRPTVLDPRNRRRPRSASSRRNRPTHHGRLGLENLPRATLYRHIDVAAALTA